MTSDFKTEVEQTGELSQEHSESSVCVALDRERVRNEQAAITQIAQLLGSCLSFAELQHALEELNFKYHLASDWSLFMIEEDGRLRFHSGAIPVSAQSNPQGAGSVRWRKLLVSAEEVAELFDDYLLERRPLWFDGQEFAHLVWHQPTAGCDKLRRFLEDLLARVLIRLELYEAAAEEAAFEKNRAEVLCSLGDLLECENLELLLARLLQISIDSSRAQVGFIALSENGSLKTACEFGLSFERACEFRLKDGSYVLSRDSRIEEAIELRPDRQGLHDPKGLRLDGLLIFPLRTSRRELGLLVLANPPVDYDRAAHEVLRTLTQVSARAVENAWLRDQQLAAARLSEQMQIARNVQLSLLPKKAPSVNGLEMFGLSMPCDETGGDFFDYLPIGDNKVAILIGDSSGHGVGAALVVVAVRACLLTAIENRVPLQEAFRQVNHRAEIDADEARYTTACCGIIDTSNGELFYVAAGHPGPLCLWGRDGRIQDLPSTGLPLGMLPESTFDASHLSGLRDGDVMIFATDGLWETRNTQGEELGRTRIANFVAANRHLSAEVISYKIIDMVTEFSGGLPAEDDRSLVVVKLQHLRD